VGRRIEITPAGELLRERGRELLERADTIVEEVRERDQAGAGRLTLGVSPTPRFGIVQRLLAECTSPIPAVTLYTTEDTTRLVGARGWRGRLGLAITFCAPHPPEGVELLLLDNEPAIVDLPIIVTMLPPLPMPFHLAYRAPSPAAAVQSVLEVARALHPLPAADGQAAGSHG
jgi:hypothetical protein